MDACESFELNRFRYLETVLELADGKRENAVSETDINAKLGLEDVRRTTKLLEDDGYISQRSSIGAIFNLTPKGSAAIAKGLDAWIAKHCPELYRKTIDDLVETMRQMIAAMPQVLQATLRNEFDALRTELSQPAPSLSRLQEFCKSIRAVLEGTLGSLIAGKIQGS